MFLFFMQEIIIKKEETEIRLDNFLRQKYPNLSRTSLQKKIKEGVVLVNNSQKSSHYFLKENDVIKINKDLKKDSESQQIHPSPLLKEIEIISDQPDYIIIDKPAGVLVHRDKTNPEQTLSDWLVDKYPQTKNVYDRENKYGSGRPGIVHRLDRNVSGLMVMAKTQLMFDFLKQQFKGRQIKKIYTALAYGFVEPIQGEIKRPLARSSTTGLMTARTDNLQDQNVKLRPAITQYQVLKYYQNYSLLKIHLKTGRTHQIRVHFKSIGHSLVGDGLYATRNLKQEKQKIEIDRIFLVSTELSFFDLNYKKQSFQIDIPHNLKNILNNLQEL